MPEQTVAAAKPQRQQYMAPFTVEVSTHNSGSWHSIVLGETYRGKWSRHKLGTLANSINIEMSAMPDIPGIRLKITPKTSKVEIFDPLEDQEELRKRIADTMKKSMLGINANAKIEAVKRSEKTLDADTFKTFVLEIYRSFHKINPVLELVSGEMPSEDDIDALPGRELYDVRSPFRKGMPKYVGDEDRIATLLRLLEEKGVILV